MELIKWVHMDYNSQFWHNDQLEDLLSQEELFRLELTLLHLDCMHFLLFVTIQLVIECHRDTLHQNILVDYSD